MGVHNPSPASDPLCMVVVREGVWVLLPMMRWEVQQLFSFVFCIVAQPAHCIHFFHGPSIPPTPLSTSSAGRGGLGLRSESIYLNFFIHTHHHITQRYPRIHHTGVTLMNIPSHSIMIYIPHFRRKRSGARAATVLFTPSLGRNWRLEGCILRRGGATMLRAIVSAASRGVYYFIL